MRNDQLNFLLKLALFGYAASLLLSAAGVSMMNKNDKSFAFFKADLFAGVVHFIPMLMLFAAAQFIFEPANLRPHQH